MAHQEVQAHGKDPQNQGPCQQADVIGGQYADDGWPGQSTPRASPTPGKTRRILMPSRTSRAAAAPG